jgi:hypothetical protein
MGLIPIDCRAIEMTIADLCGIEDRSRNLGCTDMVGTKGSQADSRKTGTARKSALDGATGRETWGTSHLQPEWKLNYERSCARCE